MDIFRSSEEFIEKKTVDSMGHVNNNIVIQEARDTHNQKFISELQLQLISDNTKWSLSNDMF